MQGTKSNTLYYLAVLYLLFSVFIYFLDSRGTLNFVHSAVQVVTIPVRSWLFDTHNTILLPLSVFSSAEQSQVRIRELEERVASLSSQLANQKALEEENAKIRHLLGTDLPAAWQFAPVRVVSVAGDTMSIVGDSTLIVGTPVVTTQGGGVWVGKVENVVGRMAAVFLPTHTTSKIPVIVRSAQDGSRRASGIVVGRGGESRLEQVLTSEILAEGDLVLTSGASLPPELLIGRVRNVVKTPGSPWQQADIDVAVKGNNLDFVFLVTKY